MAPGRKVRVETDLDPTGIRRGASESADALERLNRSGGTSMRKLAGGVAIGSAAATLATEAFRELAQAVKLGVGEMIEQEKVSARTANVIETTGKAAGVSQRHVEALAEKLQDLTGSQDDVIQSGANVLLTFTKIGARGGVFDRATAISNDLSVALGRDMPASARLVGRALNDPVKGLGALARAGVQFTDQQKEQIKTLAESGKTVEAQNIVLDALEKRFKGAAAAEGKTTESIQRIQRGYEDFTEGLANRVLPAVIEVSDWISEHWPEIEATAREAWEGAARYAGEAMDWIEKNVIPTIRAIVRAARTFWKTFGDDVETYFGFVVRQIERAMTIIRATIELVLAVIRGDWGEAWKALKTIVKTAFSGVLDYLRTIPRLMLSVGLKIGQGLANGVISGLNYMIDKINAAFDFTIPVPLGPDVTVNSPNIPHIPSIGGGGGSSGGGGDAGGGGFARGGVIPGRPGQAVRVTAHADEVILNPPQARMVGLDRIMRVLAATGGRIGGGSFATGGVVGGGLAAAYARAVGKLGTEYDYGRWDCSKFATYVAGVAVGGSTATAYGKSSPASGDEPLVWGFRKSHPGGYRGGRDEHMGVGIIDPNTGQRRWFDNGSGGVQSNADSARWQEVRVPEGWDNSGSITENLTPVQRLTRALAAIGVKGAAKNAALTLALGAGDIENPGTSLTPSEQRAVSRYGRAAGRRAAPGQESEARSKAERAATIRILRARKSSLATQIARKRARRAALWREIVAIGRSGKGTAAARATAIRAKRSARRRLAEDLDTLLEILATVNEELLDLGYEQDVEARNAAEDTTGAEGGGEISADAQAALDQQTAATTAAERVSAASDAFLRSLRSGATIDPASGSVTVNVNVAGSLIGQSELPGFIIQALGLAPVTRRAVLPTSA